VQRPHAPIGGSEKHLCAIWGRAFATAPGSTLALMQPCYLFDNLCTDFNKALLDDKHWTEEELRTSANERAKAIVEG